jgi:hypothetical protein
MVCSIHTRTQLKIVSDSIYTSILFLLNLIWLVSLILYLNKLRKIYKFHKKEAQVKKSSQFLKRYLLDLLINIVAFTYILLSINKVFARGSYKDIIYIIICLVVELFFTLNKKLYKAFIRIMTCNKYHRESINEAYKDQETESPVSEPQDQYRSI